MIQTPEEIADRLAAKYKPIEQTPEQQADAIATKFSVQMSPEENADRIVNKQPSLLRWSEDAIGRGVAGEKPQVDLARHGVPQYPGGKGVQEVGEGVFSAGTSMVGYPIALIVSTVKQAFGKDISFEEAEELKNKMMHQMTWQPPSETGGKVASTILKPFEVLSKGVDYITKDMDPEEAAQTRQLLDYGMLYYGHAAGKGISRAIKPVKSVIKSKLLKPPPEVSKVIPEPVVPKTGKSHPLDAKIEQLKSELKTVSPEKSDLVGEKLYELTKKRDLELRPEKYVEELGPGLGKRLGKIEEATGKPVEILEPPKPTKPIGKRARYEDTLPIEEKIGREVAEPLAVKETTLRIKNAKLEIPKGVDELTGEVLGTTKEYVKGKTRLAGSELVKDLATEVHRGKIDLAKHAGSKEGIVKYKEKGTQPVFAEDAKLLMKPGPDMKMGAIQTGLKSMTFATDKLPWYKKHLNKARKADMDYFREYKSVLKDDLLRWRNETKASGASWRKSSIRIGRYLTGKQKGGVKLLEFMKKKVLTEADMTPTELRIMAEARIKYNDFFKRINEVRKLSGKKPLKYVENYFTWMRNLDALRDIGMSLVEAPAKFIDHHLSATSLPWAKTRKFARNIPIELDFFDVYRKYTHDVIKHIHNTPVVAEGRAFLETFKIPTGKVLKNGKPQMKSWRLAQSQPNAANHFAHWLDTVAGKSTLAPEPWKAKAQKFAGKLNKNLGVAILSYNVRSFMVQASAIRGALVMTGGTNVLKGAYKMAVSKEARARLRRMSQVIDNRNMDIHYARIIDETVKGKLSQGKKTLGELGLKPMQFNDQITAQIVGQSFYEYAIKHRKKLKLTTEKALWEWVDDNIQRTQASGKTYEIAPVQRTAMGRLATVFQTFTINEWNWILTDVLGIKNPQVNFGTHVVRAIRMITATALINALFEGGLDMHSPFPAPEWEIARGIKAGKEPWEIAYGAAKELGEQLPVIGGTIKWSTDYRTALPIVAQLPVDTLRSLDKIARKNWDKITENDIEAAGKWLGVPGTSQIRKIISRRKKGLSWVKAVLGVVGTSKQKKTSPGGAYY